MKAAKELQENSNKIDALLSWVASLEQKGELPQYRPHPAERAGKGADDIPDGHVVGAASTAESLDEQYEGLKVRAHVSSPQSSLPVVPVGWVMDGSGLQSARWSGFPYGELLGSSCLT